MYGSNIAITFMTISWLRVLSVSQSIIGNTYAKKALQFDFDEFEHADLHAKHVYLDYSE
jgi:hypothetical protein